MIDILFGCKRNYCLPIHLDTTKENLKRIEQNATVCFEMHVYPTGVERNYNFINVFKIYFITRGIKRLKDFGLILCDLFLQCNTHTLRKQYWQ